MEFGSNSQSCGLANSTGLRSTEHVNNSRERQGSQAADATNDCSPRRLGNAGGSRQPFGAVTQDGRGIARQQGAAVVSASIAWLRERIIECRDNRARCISAQSGDEPVAYGLPASLGRRFPELRRLAPRARNNRGGRIKGYGNAIVPQVAAEFIRAFMEVQK